MSNSASTVTAASPARRKPRISLAIATALGLGYIPKAPGTFGSLAGVALFFVSPYASRLLYPVSILAARIGCRVGPCTCDLASRTSPLGFEAVLFVVVSIAGVWTASRVEAYLAAKDPQIIVIDEVSGQYLTLFVASLWPTHVPVQIPCGPDYTIVYGAPLTWECLLAGFILFRVFDIWKPFPARRAEFLPGGLGIMADDWVAGAYAALGLWLLRALRF